MNINHKFAQGMDSIYIILLLCTIYALKYGTLVCHASLPLASLNDEFVHSLVDQSFHFAPARRSIYDGSLNKNGANGEADYAGGEMENLDAQHAAEVNHEAERRLKEAQIFNSNNKQQESIHQLNNGINITSNNDIDQQRQQFLQQAQKRFLTRQLIREACQLDRGSQRDEHINNSYLAHCSRYKLENLLSSELLMSIMHHDTRDCERLLDEFVQLDEVIEQFDRLFKNLLTRYNCQNGYSVKWNCEDCKKAYTDWICATHLPFYMNGERIKPCISFCERVEQRCPYLHPITREQYGGQPVFICRDPNIPFVPTITPEIPYNDPGRCYDLCHVSDNLTELITDSLSKYDYDKCPDRSSIAEEVRNDPYYCVSSHCTLIKVALDQVGETKTGETIEDSSSDNIEKYNENRTIASPTRSGQKKVIFKQSERKRAHIHKKKLDELREVLANYKNQAKTHRYHADHSSIYHQAITTQH